MKTQEFPLRRVRSFVKRDGRMTDAQRRVLSELWPRFGLSLAETPLDVEKVFGRKAATTLEIGFGSGQSLLEIAQLHPERNFIGIEMYQPGIGTLLLGIEALQIQNIRIFYADAVEVLKQGIANDSLAGIQLFFPDPWPKLRHRKRRIVQAEFVNLVAEKLQAGGLFHLATDWEDYAKQMMSVISENPHFQNLLGEKNFAPRSTERPIHTKFEIRGLSSGRAIFELQFLKNPASKILDIPKELL